MSEYDAMVNRLRDKTFAGLLTWEEVEGDDYKTLVASFSPSSDSNRVYNLKLKEHREEELSHFTLVIEHRKNGNLAMGEDIVQSPNSGTSLHHALEELARVAGSTAYASSN